MQRSERNQSERRSEQHEQADGERSAERHLAREGEHDHGAEGEWRLSTKDTGGDPRRAE